jgi:hypothetical protein
MNLKGFFVAALSQALDLTIASPEDVLRHVTPEILATHLPRPLWARLLTACMGAGTVDARLVVETIGVPNLCEHLPVAVIWACLRDIAQKSLGQEATTEPVPTTVSASSSGPTPRPLSQLPPKAQPLAMTPPPPAENRPPPPATPVAMGPSIPTPGSASTPTDGAESDERPSLSSRGRTPAQQRFRQSNTGIGRLASSNARRPQASAAPPSPAPASVQQNARRGATEPDAYEAETEVGKDDWKNTLAVEDEQLVDWSAADETVTNDGRDETFRKR